MSVWISAVPDRPWQEDFATLDALDAVCAKYDDGGGEAEALRAAAFRRLQWRRRRGGKVCSQCGADRPLSEFGPRYDTADGKRTVCRPCDAARKPQPSADGPSPHLAARFWAKVDRSGECWVWKAGQTTNGYGKFGDTGRTWRAHRWSYELEVGHIPEGKDLDHLCRNRLCVRPDHLEPVTRLENVQRGDHGAETHCPQGHPYDAENTYRTAQGWRMCRACMAENNHRTYWADPESARAYYRERSRARYWADPEAARRKEREKYARRKAKSTPEGPSDGASPLL